MAKRTSSRRGRVTPGNAVGTGNVTASSSTPMAGTFSTPVLPGPPSPLPQNPPSALDPGLSSGPDAASSPGLTEMEILGARIESFIHPEKTHYDYALQRFATPVPPFPGVILLQTEDFKPAHRVTLRNKVDGWGFDVLGTYKPIYNNDTGAYLFSAWVFDLSNSGYPTNFDFKFYLNGSVWNDGNNLQADLGAGSHFKTQEAGGSVIFQASPAARFRYGAENVRVDRTLWVESRFRSARKTSEVFDVVVIGGGFAGGVVANALSNAGKRTLVLEFGTAQFTSHDWNLNGWMDRGDYVARQSDITGPMADGPHILLGGRSVFWSGVIPRIMPWELASGLWPQAISNALADAANGGLGYYTKAETLLHRCQTLGPYAENARATLEQNLRNNYRVEEMGWAFDLGLSSAQRNMLMWPTGVFSSVDLLNETANPSSPGHSFLEICVGQMALELLKDAAGRITGVRCLDLFTNEETIFQGRNYVLALGSVESPKLALVSKLRNLSRLDGVGLTDHPSFSFGGFAFRPGTAFPVDPEGHAKLYVASNAATATTLPMYGELGINVDYWHRRIIDPILRPTSPAQVGMYLTARSYAFLNNANRVTDQGIGQRARINYSWYSPGQYGTYNALKIEAAQFRNDVLAAVGADFIAVPSVENDRGATIQHAVGSLRMGVAGSACVDTDQRYYGHDNLFVADASVFPYAPTPNPSLTMTALALRLADLLATL